MNVTQFRQHPHTAEEGSPAAHELMWAAWAILDHFVLVEGGRKPKNRPRKVMTAATMIEAAKGLPGYLGEAAGSLTSDAE